VITTLLAGAAATPVATLGPDWLDPQTLIERFGAYALIGVVIVVFIETGLFFPILPGDSLLFTAGALVAQEQLHFPLWLLCLLVTAAAFAGDQNAYWIGRRVGPRLFNRPDSRFFKREHIEETHRYFERYGGATVIIARFVPIVRTYSAASAGIGRMHYPKFAAYDLVGAVLWGCGVTLLGYLLGNVPFVQKNIELLLVGIIALSLVPVALAALRTRRQRRSVAALAAEAHEADAEAEAGQ
jgi:membrane-associated protein